VRLRMRPLSPGRILEVRHPREAAMATPKILTVSIEFEMIDGRLHLSRIRKARDVAIEAAVDAAQEELNGNIANVRCRTTWDYRRLDVAAKFAVEDEDEEALHQEIADQTAAEAADDDYED
jgi:hypothetical protein